MGYKVTTHLLFAGQAEEAVCAYIEIFPGSKIIEMSLYDEAGEEMAGAVRTGRAEIAGTSICFADSVVKQPFSFTPSMSLYVECASEDELVVAYEGLALGGEILMPLDNYGFSRRYAWLNDRFGVSWQLNLAD